MCCAVDTNAPSIAETYRYEGFPVAMGGLLSSSGCKELVELLCSSPHLGSNHPHRYPRAPHRLCGVPPFTATTPRSPGTPMSTIKFNGSVRLEPRLDGTFC